MAEHSIAPEGPQETQLVADRILALSKTVIIPADWLGLLMAAEAVLPKRKGELVPPSELDLVALSLAAPMILFSAILCAAGSEDTFRTNRRYHLNDWLRITLKFAVLSMYVVPPAHIGYHCCPN